MNPHADNSWAWVTFTYASFIVSLAMVAVAFLRTDTKYTLPLGLQSFFQQNVTDWGSVMAVAIFMMVPPIFIFIVLNKYFSIGGIGGSLAGR